MINTATREEFANRYYLWAVNEISGEVASDFQILRQLHSNSTVSRFLNHVRTLTRNDRAKVLTACLKRRMEKTADAVGDNYSTSDKHTFAEFMRSPIIECEAQREITRKLVNGEKGVLAGRAELRSETIRATERVLGKPFLRRGRFSWAHCAEIGEWRLVTEIDLGGRAHPISYDQRIMSSTLTKSPDHARLNEAAISYFAWIGFGGQTQWGLIRPTEIGAAVNLLSHLTGYFVDAARGLLDGLSAGCNQ